MRVIGGSLKGKRFKSFDDYTNPMIRPTSDRVKESMFNILVHKFGINFSGLRVLDLFSGTGAIGLEALSRGASNVTFCEINKSACRLIRDNAKELGIEENISIMQSDCLNIGKSRCNPFRLIFMDPPYGQYLGEKVINNLMIGKWATSESLIVVEDSVEMISTKGFRILENRKYGKTVLSFAKALI